VLTEIDLDQYNLATGQYGGLGVSLTGGCRTSGSSRVNIAMNVSSIAGSSVGGSIFQHELIHAMGCSTGGQMEAAARRIGQHLLDIGCPIACLAGPIWMGMELSKYKTRPHTEFNNLQAV